MLILDINNYIGVVVCFILYQCVLHQAFSAVGIDCNKGYFRLHGMTSCFPQLNCTDWKTFKKQRIAGEGFVKQVMLIMWKDHMLALNVLKNEAFVDDFYHGLNMTTLLQPSKHVTQLIGICGQEYVTEYHKYGSAENFHEIVRSYNVHNNILTKFNMCINFVETLSFLHNSPIGTYAMCDANSLIKMLSQFLITVNLNLVANDLDALSKVERTGIRCGKREIFGDFVAPEQLWLHDNKMFDQNEMPTYNEKIDVWKIPDVCKFFLGEVKGRDIILFHLFGINKSCKNILPENRPSSKYVLHEYKRIYQKLFWSEL